MRLIDADALKEEINKKKVVGRFNTLLLIDNVPTVEPEVKKVPIASVTFDTEKLKELTDEIVESIKNGELVLQDERPQGEWINEFDSLKCPFCGMAIDDEVHWLYSEEFDFNFCPNCGAQMNMIGWICWIGRKK